MSRRSLACQRVCENVSRCGGWPPHRPPLLSRLSSSFRCRVSALCKLASDFTHPRDASPYSPLLLNTVMSNGNALRASGSESFAKGRFARHRYVSFFVTADVIDGCQRTHISISTQTCLARCHPMTRSPVRKSLGQSVLTDAPCRSLHDRTNDEKSTIAGPDLPPPNQKMVRWTIFRVPAPYD